MRVLTVLAVILAASGALSVEARSMKLPKAIDIVQRSKPTRDPAVVSIEAHPRRYDKPDWGANWAQELKLQEAQPGHVVRSLGE
jgi:hypothetical protein